MTAPDRGLRSMDKRARRGVLGKRALLAAACATLLVAWPPPRTSTHRRDADDTVNVGAKLTSTPSSVTPTSPRCPDDMLEVDGDYYNYVEQFCVSYPDAAAMARDRCFEFAPTGRTFGRPTHFRFCIDRYEWPNKKGAVPIVAVDWDYAKAHCDGIGKRLCEEREWTLACEGEERLPYPYGYARNPEACNIDRPYIQPDNNAYGNLATRDAEVRRVDQRDASGAREACVSPYGVHDMTGNVDEWVWNPAGKIAEKPYRSGLKGGYWGPVRNRCRPMTTDHNQWHTGYQIGFRCCADGTERRVAGL